MRTFAEIVSDAGDEKIAEVLAVKRHQPRDWRLRNSIPPEHWRALEMHGVSSLTELAEAAEARAAVK